ncbi:spore coat protein [Priestia aryabhattai]|uniref:Spore coat protein n=1 Tax=Priestia aryabhattai TaxID=412384 RepID=A0ABD7X4F3_PRIAR|nr:spore coat protein [Priestia aryabhattai]WEA47233.1 spore coat protein [Priestia aryabhattai]
MSSEKYYYYDVKKKCKSRDKNNDSKKHCKDSCKVDHYESESKEYNYYNNREGFGKEVFQDADQLSLIDQESNELIWIKDSCDINVTTTDTQAAIGIQVAIQATIAIIVRIAIGDDVQNNGVLQDLLQQSPIMQQNAQKICIENSKDVTVETNDTDIAVSIQALLQLLIAFVAAIDIL